MSIPDARIQQIGSRMYGYPRVILLLTLVKDGYTSLILTSDELYSNAKRLPKLWTVIDPGALPTAYAIEVQYPMTTDCPEHLRFYEKNH